VPAASGDPVAVPPPSGAILVGSVVEFDEPRGLGTVACGDRSYPFHCTAITDGTRTIAVGTVVAVDVAAGRLGRLEARTVRPVPGMQTAGQPGSPPA